MSPTLETLPAQELKNQTETTSERMSVGEIVARALEQNPHPNQATLELFAQWEREDALLSDEERAEDARIFAEIERDGIERVQI